MEEEIYTRSEQTVLVWRARWEEAVTDLQTLNIIHLEEPSPHLERAPAPASSPPTPPIATLVPSMPQLKVSPRWYRAPALYTCRVVHECDPPEDVACFGLPFFKLSLDDIYCILRESGHPSQHKDSPLVVDESADCLLLARDMHGKLGWLLVSFMYPIN